MEDEEKSVSPEAYTDKQELAVLSFSRSDFYNKHTFPANLLKFLKQRQPRLASIRHSYRRPSSALLSFLELCLSSLINLSVFSHLCLTMTALNLPKPAVGQAHRHLNQRAEYTFHSWDSTLPSERTNHSSGAGNLFLIVFYDTNRHSLHMDLEARSPLGWS